MPKPKASEQPAWVTVLRGHLRSSVIGENGRPEPGWFVGELPAGGVYLQRRTVPEGAPKALVEIARLPYQWRDTDAAAVMQRISVIITAMKAEGLSLSQAAAKANGLSTTTSTENWADTIETFHKWKLNHGRVKCSEKTWSLKYEPFLGVVQTLMRKSNPPSDATELLERLCQSNPKWGIGTRSRQIAVGNTCAFLKFAVTRAGFAKKWLPPANTAEIVGKSPATRKATPVPLTDAQILRLLESIPEDETGRRWRFLFQVMAVFGLRPEDARQLQVVDGQFYSPYQKASGGGYTEARFLFPLHVCDLDGSPIEWNLVARWQAGERFPELGDKGDAGVRVGTYLKHKPSWQALRAELGASGKQLKPYAFRHSYVRRGQLRGIPPKVLATALGHSVETHLRVYSEWDARSEMAEWFVPISAPSAAAAPLPVAQINPQELASVPQCAL